MWRQRSTPAPRLASAHCAQDNEITYAFLEDVIGEIAALTPGPYFHIGGDEAAATPGQDYIFFIERVQEIVGKHGKQMIGWEEIAAARLAPSAIAQFWNTRGQGPQLARAAAAQGAEGDPLPGIQNLPGHAVRSGHPAWAALGRIRRSA